jgi:iron(III) transport system substrate-binding protein
VAVGGSAVPGHCRRGGQALLAALVLVLSGCAQGGSGSGAGDRAAAGGKASLTLYTCVSDSTIQPVIAAFEKKYPRTRVDLFRAPTGQLDARVAADARSGGLRADVLWACDPLTQQAWVDQGLAGGWTPPGAAAIPARYRTGDYVGVALLYLVVVTHTGVPAPRAWSDLGGAAYAHAVALPDPSVAASALGALGWFWAQPGYGIGYYRQLRSNGAVQVSTPDDVTTGVAQGRYKAGLTIANSAYAAQKDGSPVAVTWPQPGAIAIYGPVALARHSRNVDAAKQFIAFVVGRAGQQVLAAAGSYPTLPGVQGPEVPANAPVVQPDWASIARQRTAVLADYRRVFTGG